MITVKFTMLYFNKMKYFMKIIYTLPKVKTTHSECNNDGIFAYM